jgi:hypothetical protein
MTLKSGKNCHDLHRILDVYRMKIDGSFLASAYQTSIYPGEKKIAKLVSVG